MSQLNLFNTQHPTQIQEDLWLLPNYASAKQDRLIEIILTLTQQSPFRKVTTASGQPFSVLMTNCGEYGWVSDTKGYRYEQIDPLTHKPWPSMPLEFKNLAQDVAQLVGYPSFTPDCCLINRYDLDSRMGLHQDRDEYDFSQPIVSVSLGLSASFLWGGSSRTDKPLSLQLNSGDTLIFGGKSRLNFHGIKSIIADSSEYSARFNLTFRKAR